MSNEPYNAADPKQVSKKTQQRNDQRTQQLADLRGLLQIVEFRRYLWQVMHEYCGVLKSPFSTNGSVMNLNAGMGDIGRRLWADIEQADPLSIPRMMTEFYESRHE